MQTISYSRQRTVYLHSPANSHRKRPLLPILTFAEVQQASSGHWQNYWTQGAVADFSQCTDVRAKELERRVVLSQYLLAIQCAGSTPPQETGLTYNSWFGKFHLE